MLLSVTKKTLLLVLLFGSIVATAHGKNNSAGYTAKTWGWGITTSTLPISLINIPGPFVEYKCNESIGIRSALSYGFLIDSYTIGFKQGDFRGLLFPVTLQYYPGADRQFCLSGGVKTVYLLTYDKRAFSKPITFQPIGGLEYEFVSGWKLGLNLTYPISFDVFSIGYNFARLL